MEFKAYHGSDHKIKKFSDEFTGREGTESAEGVGIYTTNSKENAKMWGNYIYSLVLKPRKVITNMRLASEIDKEEMKRFLDLIDDENYTINRAEDIESDKWASIEDAINYSETEDEAWYSLAYEQFTNSHQELLRAMTKMGYDMVLLKKGEEFKFDDADKVFHYIIYNPDIIEIVGVEKKKDEISGEYEDTVIDENKSYEEQVEGLKNIKSFDEIDEEKLDLIISKYGYEGFNDYDNAMEELWDVLNTDYPNGYKNIPNTAILYRVLCLENPKKIKKGKDIGQHWLMHTYNIDAEFTETIGIDCYEEDLYVITAEMPRENINVLGTLAHNLRYPREYEVNLKNFDGINIKKIETYDEFDQLQALREFRKIIRETIYKEAELDEAAMRLSHLPEGTALFIKEINDGYDMTLYNPKTKDAYAHIAFGVREGVEDYYIFGVAAERGFGPFIYELAMMHINKEGKGLMPTRDGDVRGESWNVWEIFYKNRSDVKKKTLDILDPAYNFNLIEDIYWDDDKEKMEIYNELDSEDKENLIIFNTAYFMKPSEEYYKLIEIANTWEQKGFDKDIAVKAGDDLWSEKYGL